MAIREGLLALLSRGPRYGYQLRTEFEASTGAIWPLNIGQVYTTLSRLERDGLVTGGEQDAQGRVVYTITEAGRAEMERWLGTPVAQSDRPRDELVIKLAMAVAARADVRPVIRAQRTATMRTLQELTRARRASDREPARRLVLDSLIFQAEAEQRWLDHCEAVLAASTRTQETPEAPPADPGASPHEEF
ncbi:PadR family transcriptional regulator [Planomonospora corallina]|uniref:PadR family transcriptional regulator n=1 Tax=Planomonospora corallina TaxID=1806052 RepID=A0ABV8IBD4_9ACTN